MTNGRYVPIEAVRPLVQQLENHYGTLPQVSQALGIPYKTLQGIMLVGKSKQTTKVLADKLARAVANPPEAQTEAFWDKRYVPTEKLKPLVEFLGRTYGTLADASRATGIPESSLRGVRGGYKRGVKKEIAIQIVEAVQRHRYGDRTWNTFENEEGPRFATQEEQELPNSFSRWRAAGGRKRLK